MDQKLFDFIDQQVEHHIPQKQWQGELINEGFSQEDINNTLHETIKRRHSEFQKKLIHRLLDIALPLWIFTAFFLFYNHGKITTSEMIKNTGLTSITVISLTLLVGPVSKFIKPVNMLKIHRKFWGVAGFLVAIAHSGLAFYAYFDLSLAKLFNPENEHFIGILSGLAAILAFLVITGTSNKRAIDIIGAKNWKLIQTASYLALVLVILHFYLMETNDGIFVIRRLLGRFAFGFAGFVILFRLFVLFLIFFEHRKPPPTESAYQAYLKNLPPTQTSNKI